MTDAPELKRQIAKAEGDLVSLRAHLRNVQASCKHDWSKPKYDPIVREGYRDPGDPPGTMGVDWRGPQWISREEEPRWSRYCPKCDLTEYTDRTQAPTVQTKIPDFGTR